MYWQPNTVPNARGCTQTPWKNRALVGLNHTSSFCPRQRPSLSSAIERDGVGICSSQNGGETESVQPIYVLPQAWDDKSLPLRNHAVSACRCVLMEWREVSFPFPPCKGRCRSPTGRRRQQRHARVDTSTWTQHASCKCPFLTGSSGKTTTLFFAKHGFNDKRKGNLDLFCHSRSAGRGPASIRPRDFAGRCLRHSFRCAIALLTADPFKCMAPVPSLWQKSLDRP